MSARNDNVRGLAYIATAATIWGSIGVFVRMVDAHPAVIVFWRVAFAGVTIGLIAAFRGRLAELASLPMRKRLALAAMGALLSLNWVLFMAALQLTDVAIAVLLAYCGPVFVAALTPLVMKEPFDKRVLFPLALALTGTVIIVSPADITFTGGTSAIGASLAFSSAITYAVLVLNAKRLLKGISATVYMLGEYAAAGVLLLPAVFLFKGPVTPVHWLALLFLGVVTTGLTGLLFLSGLRHVRADHAAILTYAEPVSAVAFAAAFLGESVTTATLIGGLAVLAGGLAVTRLKGGASVEGPPVLIDVDAHSSDEPGGPKREDT